MVKNQTDDATVNQSDEVEPAIDDKILQRYKDIFSAYIENGDEYSLYELSKLVRVCMDNNVGPEILLDMHFSTISEFMDERERNIPILLKRLANYDIIYYELFKGLRDKVKEAEEKLRQIEKHYRLIADNATDVIWTVDMNMHLTYASPSITHLLGYSVEESMVNTMEEVFTISSYERAVKALAEELEIENSEQKDVSRSRVLELDLRRKDGSIVTVEGHFRLLRDPNGQPVEILAMVRDITDRKKAAEMLRESEKRYRLLADNASDVIWTVDMNMRPTYISPSVTRLLGYSVEEAIATTLTKVFTPASYGRAMKALAEELEIENSEQKDLSRSRVMELDVCRKDGSIVTVEGHFSFLRDPNGKPVEILAMVRDITERKSSEYALKESEEKFSKAFRSSPNIFVISRIKDGIILDINDSFERITDYSREEVIGHTAIEFGFWANTEDRERVVQMLKEQGTVSNEEIEFRMKSGEIRTVLLSAEMSNIGGEPCIIFIAVDVTDRKEGTF